MPSFSSSLTALPTRSRAKRTAGMAVAEPKGGTGPGGAEAELTATTSEELAAPDEEAATA